MAEHFGLHPVINSVRRNWAEQEQLYRDWLAGLRQYPANPPGQSAHQYGVAFDSSVPAAEQHAWDQIRAHWGWKLYANDPVHAEFPNWQKYRNRLKLT